MIAQPGIDRDMHTIRSRALLVAVAELQKLRALARLDGLAAAIVGHVAANDDAAQLADPFARAGQTRRDTFDG